MSVADLVSSKYRTRIGELYLDATVRESHDLQVDVTEFPVEKGAEIGDNILPKPRGITIEGVVTDTPVQLLSDRIRSLAEGRKNYAQLAFEYLESLWSGRDVIDIYTKFKIYRNMAMTSAPVNRVRADGRALVINATFRQVNFVSFSSSVYGKDRRVDKDSRKPKKVNNRESASDSSSKGERRASTLHDIFAQ